MGMPQPPKSDLAPSVLRTRLRTLMTELDCCTYRELGRKLQVDFGYLYRLSKGTATNPSAEVLAKLGLKRVVTYERL